MSWMHTVSGHVIGPELTGLWSLGSPGLGSLCRITFRARIAVSTIRISSRPMSGLFLCFNAKRWSVTSVIRRLHSSFNFFRFGSHQKLLELAEMAGIISSLEPARSFNHRLNCSHYGGKLFGRFFMVFCPCAHRDRLVRNRSCSWGDSPLFSSAYFY